MLFLFGETDFKELDVQASTVDEHVVSKSNPSRVRVDLTARRVMAAFGLIYLLARTNMGYYIAFRHVETLLQSFGESLNMAIKGADRTNH